MSLPEILITLDYHSRFTARQALAELDRLNSAISGNLTKKGGQLLEKKFKTLKKLGEPRSETGKHPRKSPLENKKMFMGLGIPKA